MAFPGYTAPTDLIIDSGALFVGVTPVGMSPSRGGITFDPGMVVRTVPFDGETTGVAGLQRITEYTSKFSGKLLDCSTASLMRLNPGSTSSDSGSDHIVTPKDATVMFVDGDYLKMVTWKCRRMSGGTHIVTFPVAYVEKYKLASTDKSEGEYDVSIVAVLAIGSTGTALNACPFTFNNQD